MRWLLLLVAVGASAPASASTRTRIALIVGVNAAAPGETPLRYAHDDAQKMRDVLVELGDVAADDVRLLLEPTAATVREGIDWLRRRAAEVPELEVVFYFSGHSDSQGLQVGDERILYEEVRQLLRDERARVRVAILDSCGSGAASLTKGGQRLPPVEVEWRTEPDVRGSVLISSSAPEEAAVERDELGGSLFTHFFVSGLRGAADVDDDGQVTLDEAFRYARDQALVRSAETRAGVQHAGFDFRVAGQGPFIVTRLRQQSAAILFDADLEGTYIVFNRQRAQVIAEVRKEAGSRRRLRLPVGEYFVKKRLVSAVLLERVTLGEHDEFRLREHEMHTVPFSEDVTKGGTSPAFRPTWRYGAPIIDGTAHVLRRGELQVGLFSSSGYGITDAVTLTTNIPLDLLLTPNLNAKVRVAQSDAFTWAMTVGVSQSFAPIVFLRDRRSSYGLSVGTALSWGPTNWLTLTLSPGWRLSSRSESETTTGSDPESQLIHTELTATVLLGERDLLQAGVYNDVVLLGLGNAERLSWGGELFYAHAWETFHLGVGARYFTQPFSTPWGSMHWLPVVDVWWRW